MPTIEERVSHLEIEMAGLQGQLRADMKHIDGRFDVIDGRFDGINKTSGELSKKLDTLNNNIATINTTGQLAKQSSSTNEQLIWAIGAFLAATAAFVLGQIL